MKTSRPQCSDSKDSARAPRAAGAKAIEALSKRAGSAVTALLLGATLVGACGGGRFAAGAPGADDAGASGEAPAAGTGGSHAAGRGGSAGRGQDGGAGGQSAGRGGAIGTAGAAGLSGQAPPIPNGFALWLAADRGITETQGGVAKWADSSGNAMHATQSVGDERPRVVSVDGELPMVEFDGANDSLSLADGFDDFSAGLSFFAVVEVVDAPSCSSIVHLSNGAEVDDIHVGLQGRTLSYEVAEQFFESPEAFEFGQRILVGVIHRAATDGVAELRLDGEYLSAAEPGVAATVTRYDNFVGGSLYEPCEPFEGRIGEILLYPRALEQRERVQVESYLKQRWQPAD